MPKKDSGGDSFISESGNWNVADKYSKYKIMKPLVLCDYYEDLAIFGYESIEHQLMNYQNVPDDIVRYKALDRLIRELIRLIDNTKFAMKAGNTKQEVLKYKSMLIRIGDSLPQLMRVSNNNIDHTRIFKINNPIKFEKYLTAVSKIKSKINEPLNKNHLIFTDKEEFDPQGFKDQMKRRIISSG